MFTQTHTRIFCFFLLCLTYCYPTTNSQAQTTFGPQQVISTNADAAFSVYAIDLDGDGDNDVLSASANDDKIAWYRNDGNGNFSTEQIISTNANGAISVYAIDIDGDGDNDVLSASPIDNKIAWYINDGSGNVSTEQIISTNAGGARYVYAIDLDGDGDNDVLSASFLDDKIAWYINDGNGNFSIEQIISSIANGAQSVYAIDIDSDGDNDVLSASANDDKIAWYINDGNGYFSSEQIISNSVDYANAVFAIDLDGDGDNDVLSASGDDDKIAWYINDGSGNFSAEQIISTNSAGIRRVYAIDLDNDGDNDVLSASWSNNKITGYLNDGNGNFSTEQIISTNTYTVAYVYAIDLDGDGDNDVLSASYNNDKIAWYENILLSPTDPIPPIANFTTTPTATPAAPNPDTLYICSGQTVYTNNLSSNANAYLWNFGDGSTPNTQTNPTHTYTQAGTYPLTLIAYNNTPSPFTCEANAGYPQYGIEGGFGGIQGYNNSLNYTQSYLAFDVDSNMVSIHSTLGSATYISTNEYIVAVNYLTSEVTPANTIGGLQQQVANDECIDFDVYSVCGLQGTSLFPIYDAAYGGYLIMFNPGFFIPQNPLGNYDSYVYPYHVAFTESDWFGFGLVYYLLDTNYQPFFSGDTIQYCPMYNGVTQCCQTIIIPNTPPGGGTPEPLAPNPIVPLYSARPANSNEVVLSDTTNIVVVVQPALAPDITCISTLCANDTAQYHTNALCANYQWDVIGGTIISGQNTPDINVVWANTPEGTISLTAACDEAYCNLPTVVAVPIITQTATIAGKHLVCLNEVLNYTVPFFGGTTYNWTIDPPQAGEIIAGNNSHQITVRWTNMEATLTASYQNQVLGCNGTANLNITPMAAFAIDTLAIVCQGTQSTLNTTENGEFTWSVVGGNIVSGQGSNSIVVNWTSEGTATVNATANNPNSFCNLTANASTTVLAFPQSPTIIGQTIICPTQTYLYSASPTQNNTTFVWTATGGTITAGQSSSTVSVVWNGLPPYSLSVVRQTNSQPACLSNPTTLAVSSFTDGGSLSILGDNVVCPALTVSYTATPNITNLLYEWSISPTTAGQIIGGQGTANIAIQWATTTPPDATLTVTACSQTANYTINFADAPQPLINQNNVLCSNNTATLSVTNVADISQYTWQTETGSTLSNAPTATINEAGIYTLSVINSSGCLGYDAISVIENTAPVANILSPSYLVCIQDALDIPLMAIDGTNYAFEWLLNGVPIADTNSPFYTHPATDVAGNFTYQVNVTDVSNNCITLSDAANIIQALCVPDTSGGGGTGTGGPTDPNCPPTAGHEVSFSLASDGENCQTVTLTQTSVDVFTQFIVFWGDGAIDTLTGNTATHTYPNNIALYTVRLRGWFVHLNTGALCYKTHNEPYSVPLAARFDVLEACLGNEWQFMDRSYYLPTTSISNWLWDFGDGSPIVSGSQTAAHTYTTAGSFVVTLTITDGNCTISSNQTITVAPLPTLNFSVDGGACVDNVLHFTPSNPNLISYVWSFGDGATSSTQNAAHQYNAASNYTANLSATTNLGCVVTANPQTISINPQPQPQNIVATDTLLCSGETTTLTAPLGVAYLWSTGSVDSSIVVSAAGNYVVKVTLADGCYYTTSAQNINVTLPLNATIYPSSDTAHFCASNTAQFLYVNQNENYTYAWGPSVGTTYQKQVYYNSTYTITVTDTQTGCTATDNTVVQLHSISGVPIVAGNTTDVCQGETAQLWVSNNMPSADHFVWTNGVEDSLINITTSGNYGVYAVDNWGCVSDTSAVSTITINALPNVDLFPAGCYELCQGDTLSLPIGTASNYQWFFNNTLLTNNTANFVPQAEGDYFVVMTNDAGCTDTSGILSLQFKTNCPTNNPLPISLIDFSGTVKEQGNLLHWASATEINANHYTLYYSNNGEHFVPINTTKASGNSNTTKHYQYLHNSKAALSYYRLEETDYDGTTHKLGTIVLHRLNADAQNVLVYPNPAQTTLQINYQTTQAQLVTLQIYDIMGRLLHTQTKMAQANANNWQIDVNSYPTGIYWLQIGEQTIKWTKF
jgi:PKD repeat protein